MRSEIQLTFENCKKEKRPALLTYTVASDPNKKKSLQIINSIAKHADIIELGFPHSTPVGDGGQIQTSSNRAIKNGFKMRDTFQIVNKFKKIYKDKPVILMGYYNMIYQYGEANFLKDCKKSGVNGIIVVDLPWPENINFSKKCDRGVLKDPPVNNFQKTDFRNFKNLPPEMDSTGQKTILRRHFLGVYLDSNTLKIAFENWTFRRKMTKKSQFC